MFTSCLAKLVHVDPQIVVSFLNALEWRYELLLLHKSGRHAGNSSNDFQSLLSVTFYNY
jgi:hypothetical protein